MKQFIYYEQVNLFLKERLALFESNGYSNLIDDNPNLTFDEKLDEVINFVKKLKEGNLDSDKLDDWLEQIEYFCIPKKVSSGKKFDEEKIKNFISNEKVMSHIL